MKIFTNQKVDYWPLCRLTQSSEGKERWYWCSRWFPGSHSSSVAGTDYHK